MVRLQRRQRPLPDPQRPVKEKKRNAPYNKYYTECYMFRDKSKMGG